MRRINITTAILITVLSFSCLAVAQTPRAYRMSEDEVRALLGQIEKGSDRFRASLDNALDRSPIDGSRAEDNINNFIRDFERATDRLKSRFGDNRSAANDVEDVLERGAIIDRFMIRHSLTQRAQEDWASLRAMLDRLASAYNVTWDWGGTVGRPSRMSENEMKALLARLEKNADRFRSSLDAALDRSRYDGSQTEDNINQFMKNFEEASDRLKNRYDDNQTATGIVEDLLQRAVLIDGFVDRRVPNVRAREDWMAVRNDLEELAKAYDVSWHWQLVVR